MHSEPRQIPWSQVTLLELFSWMERYRRIIQPLASGCLLSWVNLRTKATPQKGQQLGGSIRRRGKLQEARRPWPRVLGACEGCVRRQGL